VPHLVPASVLPSVRCWLLLLLPHGVAAAAAAAAADAQARLVELGATAAGRWSQQFATHSHTIEPQGGQEQGRSAPVSVLRVLLPHGGEPEQQGGVESEMVFAAHDGRLLGPGEELDALQRRATMKNGVRLKPHRAAAIEGQRHSLGCAPAGRRRRHCHLAEVPLG
jgi:hypothetical protein